MQIRLRLFGLVLLACPAFGSTAYADVAPDPGRPEWNDTPLPMPADPDPKLLGLMSAALAAGAFAVARRVRR